jgi:hypothetical protein
MAKVTTILPYSGVFNYGSDEKASIKSSARLYGVHASSGTLSYLLEADYSHIQTRYKDSTLDNLSQDDISLAYASYSKYIMFKYGAHYINTNDEQLGNAIVGFISLEAYHYFAYDKLKYGINTYQSFYRNGHDELYKPTSISITQYSPYLSYYKAIDLNWGNTILLQANLESASNYIQKEYKSYEISDTIFYKSIFVTLTYYNGEMRTGIKDNGFTVFNSLDLMKDGFNAKMNYYFTKNAIVSISYGKNRYEEYDVTSETITHENTNSVLVASLSYSY